jgi:molecular chaperone Hsp33
MIFDMVKMIPMIRRFLFKALDIRGQHLNLNKVWQKITHNRAYAPRIQTLLGELLALGIILAEGIKHSGKLTLQVKGNGKVSLLLVEVTHDLKVRAMVRSEALDEQDNLDNILGDGQIIATIFNAQTQHSFQSVVVRNSTGLIATFEDYFSNSEQLAAKIWVASDDKNLGAMYIQKMPKSSHFDSEDWARILSLSSTIDKVELKTLDAKTLLNRLFHEEALTIFEEKMVLYGCTDERKKFEQVVFNLGEKDAKVLLKERGEISIHNEICNEHLFFNEADVNKIFKQES